jgi:serine/threonine-protein phosphatase 2B regulatory subunit
MQKQCRLYRVLRKLGFLQDGLIHKDEFALALFKLHGHDNLFVDRVFKIFDSKHNDVVDFEEFVRALSVFHPKAPLNEKADCEALTHSVQTSCQCAHAC